MTFSGSSFAVVEPEQGIVFPLVKKEDSKLLKYSWNPDPTHTYTRTHRKVRRHSVLLS